MILTYKPIHETLKGCYHIYSNKEIQPIGSFEVDNNKVICRLSKSAKIFIGTYETIEEAWIEIEKIVQAKYEQPSYYFTQEDVNLWGTISSISLINQGMTYKDFIRIISEKNLQDKLLYFLTLPQELIKNAFRPKIFKKLIKTYINDKRTDIKRNC